MTPKPTVILLTGPTASGKSALALRLAKALNGALISADSAQVYRGLDIGTAKPDAATQALIPHHLIDLIEVDERYSAARFAADANTAIETVLRSGKQAIVVGGSMLYLQAWRHGLATLPKANHILRQQLQDQARQQGWEALHQRLCSIDPSSGQRIHSSDARRIERALEIWYCCRQRPSELYRQQALSATPYPLLCIGLWPQDRQQLHQQIEKRLQKMLQAGLEQEAKALFLHPQSNPDCPAQQIVGYRQWQPYFAGQCSREQVVCDILTATRRLLRRQLTWMRRMEDLQRIDSQSLDVERLLCWIKGRLAGTNADYTVNDMPQPQVATALGLRTTKREPSKPLL